MDPEIHFIYGQESYFISQKYNQLISNLVRSDTDRFNFERFEGDTLDISRLRGSLLSLPMMADKRVVSVSNLQNHFTGKISKIRQQEWDSVIDAIPESAVLVLTAILEPRNLKSYPWSFLIKRSNSYEFPRFRYEKVDEAILSIASSKGINIDHEIAAYLKNRYEGDYYAIELEIEKIKNYSPNIAEFRFSDLALLLNLNERYTLNTLTSELANRSIDKVLEISLALLSSGMAFPYFLAAIKNFFVNLFKYLEASKRFNIKADIAKAVGVPPFFIRDYAIAARQYTLTDVEKSISAITECEFMFKSVSTSAEDLVVKLLIPSFASNGFRDLR